MNCDNKIFNKSPLYQCFDYLSWYGNMDLESQCEKHILSKNEFFKLNPIWTSIFSVMFGALITGLKFVFKKLNVLTTDESIIRKRVKKAVKRLNNIAESNHNRSLSAIFYCRLKN